MGSTLRYEIIGHKNFSAQSKERIRGGIPYIPISDEEKDSEENTQFHARGQGLLLAPEEFLSSK